MSDSTNNSSSTRPRMTSGRSKVVFEQEDPLSKISEMPDSMPEPVKVKKENLTIRLEDEVRIVTGMHSAAKKQTTGSIYSVVVDISKSGTLGIGVKDLSDNILAVSMLKRENNTPGPGEEAGIRLGDIIFGINFVPTREGSRTLINVIKRETQKKKKILHIQAWRCHQLCSDNIPGYVFPRADEVIVQAYSLFRTKVFSDWERWNFIEILLGHMIEDLKQRTYQTTQPESAANGTNSSPMPLKTKVKQMQVLDLERNILQAKGLRTALCARIVHTKLINDTVIYVLRVEDVESGLQWVVHRRFRDFFGLNDELLEMSHFAKEIDFPRRRIALRNSAKLVEMRIVALEQYIRKMLHLLTLYATMDSAASRSLRHLQNFLGVDRYVDCVHPPLVDDQRYIELMAYRFLNDFSSPACQQCVRFITTIDLDAVVEAGPEGYRSVLTLVKDALAEVEQFVEQQHQQQMMQALRDRRPELEQEQLRSFVRKCIRRQVEAALFLPLRRNVFRIVYSFVAQKSKQMQRSMTLLQQATPNYLMVDSYVSHAKALPNAVKAFRKVIQAYLPADQGQLLIEAAGTVTELHRECHEEKMRLKALGLLNKDTSIINNASAEANGHNELVERLSAARISAKSAPRNSGSVLTPPPPVKRQESSGTSSTKTNSVDDSTHSVDDSNYVSSASAPSSATNARRNSITNRFFRTNSVKDVASPGHNDGPDLISKATLADPVSTIFSSDETPEVFGKDDGTAGIVENEDKLMYDPTRISFSDASVSMSVGAMLNISPQKIDSSSQIVQQQSNTSFNERSQHNLDMINTAIFDTPNSDNALVNSDGTPFNVLMSCKGSVGIDSSSTDKGIFSLGSHHAPVRSDRNSFSGVNNLNLNSDAHAVRPKSARMLSLLDDMLDGKGGKDSDDEDQVLVSKEKRLSISGSKDKLSSGNGSRDLLASADTPTVIEEKKTDNNKDKVDVTSSNGQSELEKQQQTLEKDISSINDLLPAVEGNVLNTADDTLIVNNNIANSSNENTHHDVISADDFLPLFTYVLVQAGLPQLLLVKELMLTLVDDEDTYGECGYYLATLEAATQHICDLAEQYEKVADIDSLFQEEDDIFEFFDKKG